MVERLSGRLHDTRRAAHWRNVMLRITGTTLIRIALCMALVCAFAATTSADTFMRQVHHTPEMQYMGQVTPARTDTGTIWVAEDRVAALTNKNSAVVVRADLGRMYMIDHNAKKYTELPVNFNELMDSVAAAAGEDLSDEKLQQAKQMMAQMMGEVKMTVTPTDETQEIRGYNTRKYIVDMSMSMGQYKTEMWVAKDVKINTEALWSATNAMLAILPGFDDMIAKMKSIEGLPIKSTTTTTMMGQEMVSTFEVVELITKDAPAGTYEVPEGYTKESFGAQMPGMEE